MMAEETPVATVTTAEDLQVQLVLARQEGQKVGFVPTMGGLHAGHSSLMRASVAACDFTVVSIYVNPLQFAPSEDLATYPRDFAADSVLCATQGVDLIFCPSIEEMQKALLDTSAPASEMAGLWEGVTRPDHFAGVATVVAALFSLVGSCQAFFGEKDFQQLAVVHQLVQDLNLPVSVVGCPTWREIDGLALSSRNVYLTAAQRAQAPVLYQALKVGADLITSGATKRLKVEAAMTEILKTADALVVDYCAVVDPQSLQPVEAFKTDTRLLVAGRFGATRLLDNRAVQEGERYGSC
jgi:pantoate--beta-alanine ligase